MDKREAYMIARSVMKVIKEDSMVRMGFYSLKPEEQEAFVNKLVQRILDTANKDKRREGWYNQYVE